MKKIFLLFFILTFSLLKLEAQEDNTKIVVIKKQEFQTVDKWYANYIKQAVNKANQDGASLIILELDTPGGLVSEALSIKNTLINSNVPVVINCQGCFLLRGASKVMLG